MLTFLHSCQSSPSNLPARKGFGLVELMVSISIMALVSTIIITRQGAFNGAVLLRNQSYEIAFAIREAQLLAVSGGGNTRIRRYGVAFDTVSRPTTYQLFGDGAVSGGTGFSNGTVNGRYDAAENIGLIGRLDRRFVVRSVFVDSTEYAQLAVTFRRPNFDADFCVDTNDCHPNSFIQGTAYIDIALADNTDMGLGDVRRVAVSATGQVRVTDYVNN